MSEEMGPFVPHDKQKAYLMVALPEWWWEGMEKNPVNVLRVEIMVARSIGVKPSLIAGRLWFRSSRVATLIPAKETP